MSKFRIIVGMKIEVFNAFCRGCIMVFRDMNAYNFIFSCKLLLVLTVFTTTANAFTPRRVPELDKFVDNRVNFGCERGTLDDTLQLAPVSQGQSTYRVSIVQTGSENFMNYQDNAVVNPSTRFRVRIINTLDESEVDEFEINGIRQNLLGVSFEDSSRSFRLNITGLPRGSATLRYNYGGVFIRQPSVCQVSVQEAFGPEVSPDSCNPDSDLDCEAVNEVMD